MCARERERPLREGFTTGSAAAAAAKACVLLLHGRAPEAVDIPTPDNASRLRIAIARAGVVTPGREAWGHVVKDGGDDPDATHGMTIRSRVLLHPPENDFARSRARIRIEGGAGVGRVTLPGLPLPPGHAAINPGPRRQIALALAEGLAETACPCRDMDVLVEAPGGHVAAAKTMNARLGIMGGISILGTGGIVKPFSHDAWRASVEAGCKVAKALGYREIGLTTGRRSERLLRRELPTLPEMACVQMADLFSHALGLAGAHGFERVNIACYGGKLVKMAQGLDHTHASRGALDFEELARRCQACGLPPEIVAACRKAVTARHVFELARAHGLETALAQDLGRDALRHARMRTGPGPELRIFAFSFDDSLLALVRQPGTAK